MGNFHDAERLFSQADGVWVTASGFAGGTTANPTYQEVCTGLTGHAQVVLVVFDPAAVSYAGLLKLYWEGHDPTQKMRQGSDIGTFFRSAIYAYGEAQYQSALAARDVYQNALHEAGFSLITTQITAAPEFYFAETEHQQYFARTPNAAHGLRGTGVAFASPASAIV
jgi:peptide-methionine (S)-S-oxide reductase